MVWGILEPSNTTHVAGTVLLDQEAAHSDSTTGQLKHSSGKDANIILSPQPSADPNDPLNWSTLKRNGVMLVIFLGVMTYGVLPNPILNPGIVNVAEDIHRSVTDVAEISGYLLLATGAVGPFASAFARKYGKRPVYVASSLIGFIGVIIGETAKDYSTLLAARIVQGIGIAAYEALGIATVGDLFFVHERGVRIVLIMFLLVAISNAISIIAGLITSSLGWPYVFHLSMPLAGLQLILIIFFAPETTYRRRHIYDTDVAGSEEDLGKLARHEMHVEHVKAVGPDAVREDQLEKTLTQQYTVDSIPPKMSYWQSLRLYNGTFVDDPLWKMLLACPAILLNLGALYQIVTTGLVVAWGVALSVLAGVIFAMPPYTMKSSAIGYMSIGPLIGGLLACVIRGLVAEPVHRSMTRANRGIYEPEFALLPSVVGFLATIGGLIGWGYAVQEFKSVYLISFLWGLVAFGLTWVAACASQWALDAFRSNSSELFIMNAVFKNFFFYGLVNYIIQWYVKGGAVQVAAVVSSVNAFLLLLLIPLWIFGKRYRSYWQHHNMIQKLHLETSLVGTGGH